MGIKVQIHLVHSLEIAKGVGSPIEIDKVTLSGKSGKFARVHIDVDFAKEYPSSLWATCGKRNLQGEILYEFILLFFSHCSIVGHVIDRCILVTKALYFKQKEQYNKNKREQDPGNFKRDQDRITLQEKKVDENTNTLEKFYVDNFKKRKGKNHVSEVNSSTVVGSMA